MKSTIKIEDIKIIRNPRTEVGDVSELMTSIREVGLLEPIGIWFEQGNYFIAYGHRRFFALKKLGRKELIIGEEVKIINGKPTEEELIILQNSENYHQKPISAIEYAKDFKKLIELGFTKSEISAKFGFTKHKVESFLDILGNVPEKYHKGIGSISIDRVNDKRGILPVSVVSEIARMRTSKEVTEKIYDLAHKNEWSVKDISLIRRMMVEIKNFDKAVKEKDNYFCSQVNLVINKKQRLLIKGSLNNYIVSVLKGKVKPIINLIY